MAFVIRQARPLVTSVLLALYLTCTILLLDQGLIIRRFASLGVRAGDIASWSELIIKRGIFTLEHVAAIAAIVAACISTSRLYALAITLLFFLGLTADFAHYYIRGIFPNLDDLATVLEGLGQAKEIAVEYSRQVLLGLASALLITAPSFYLLTKRRRPTIRWAGSVSAALICVLSMIYIAIARDKGEQGLSGFPRGMGPILGTTALLLLVDRPQSSGTQMLETIESIGKFSKIIVIIDESITTSVFRELEAPLLERHDVYVYPGEGFSDANISAASNYFFRKTIRQGNKHLEVASIFELARTHQYKTLYIDNQGVLVDPGAKNYFDSHELGFVDQIINNYPLPSYTRDQTTIHQLNDWLKANSRAFVLVNKLGAHIPYEQTLPPDQHTPDRYENYRRSVARNSVDFLIELANNISDDTIVLYTSDHGQNPHAIATHGNSGAVAKKTEWEVPFVIITRQNDFRRVLANSPLFGSALLSHADFVEVIRNLIGYSSRGPRNTLLLSNQDHSFCGHFGPPYKIFGNTSNRYSCKELYLNQ